MPCCPEEQASDQRSDALTSRLLRTRTILINGEVDQEMAERVTAQLLVMDADGKEPIKVIVTSQGGHVDSGFAIYDVMRFVTPEIIAIGAGWVASIAVPILFGADKKNRYALPNTRFLIHQPSGGAGGQAADIRIEAQEIIKIRHRLNEMIAAETGQTVEKIAHDSDRNFWMNAEEAKQYGLISKVIKSSKEIKW